MPALSSAQAALIDARNITNLKAAKNGAVPKAVYYKPAVLVGDASTEDKGHDPAVIAFLKANSAVKKQGTITIKEGLGTNPGSLTFGGGLASPPAEAKTWLEGITKKKLI